MDNPGVFDKIWSFAMVFVGGLFSYFIAKQNKLSDTVEAMDKRQDNMEINQAGYDKSVEFIIKRFDKFEDKFEKAIDKLINNK